MLSCEYIFIIRPKNKSCLKNRNKLKQGKHITSPVLTQHNENRSEQGTQHQVY